MATQLPWNHENVLTTPPVSLYSIFALSALAILGSFLQIRPRGLEIQLSLRFFAVLISAAVVNWPATVAVACVSALVESVVWIKPRRAWKSTVVHCAVAVLAASAAYATFHISYGVSSPLLMVLAAIVYFGVNSIAAWKQPFFWTFPSYAAGGSAAGLLVIADRHNGWEITLLMVPMLSWMVHAYRLY